MKRSAAEAIGNGGSGDQQQDTPAERLNPSVLDLLNFLSMKESAVSLHKNLSRLFEHVNSLADANATPIWQDLMGHISMLNLGLFRISEDAEKVSQAFVVHPKNVTSETAAGMLSSKVLPETEKEQNSMRGQIFQGMEYLPVSAQIESLTTRIDMIREACESVEQVIAEARQAHFGIGGHSTNIPTYDLVKAALIRDEEEILRNAVNHGEGLRIPGGPQENNNFPAHIKDALNINERQSEAIYQSNECNIEDYLRSSPYDSPGTFSENQLNDKHGPAQDTPASNFMK